MISGNTGDGVSIQGQGNEVEGNLVGTDENAATAVPNDTGVRLHGGGNLVGGSAGGAGNVVSSNSTGVRVESGPGNTIQGNLVGTDGTGTAALGGSFGVIVDAAGTIVGGANPGEGNVLSGMDIHGLQVLTSGNTVQGNKIGTNAAGDAAIPSDDGMIVTGDYNTIGGTTAGEANLVSGNSFDGLEIEPDFFTADPAEGNVIEGNLIGTNAAGDAALPNRFEGIELEDSSDNVIGGSAPDAGNVISGNGGDGVVLELTNNGVEADGNQVVGNAIGTDAGRALLLGNGENGVRIEDAEDNRVGAADETAPVNTIAHNGEDGVAIEGGLRNAVIRTETFDNGDPLGTGDLGIDLDSDGVTPNDVDDLDVGTNDLQNHPVLTGATGLGATTRVDWELDALPSTRYRLEFYATATCDASGSGEAESYLGSKSVVTDANGDAAGSTDVAAAGVGRQVTATAGVRVPPVTDDTSELSPCEPVV